MPLGLTRHTLSSTCHADALQSTGVSRVSARVSEPSQSGRHKERARDDHAWRCKTAVSRAAQSKRPGAYPTLKVVIIVRVLLLG